MYKRTFKTIVSICLIYSVLLSIVVLYSFFRSTKMELETNLVDCQSYFENEFKSLNIKNNIISEYIFSNEHIGQYVNNNDKLAKYMLQRELNWFADIESPSICSIAFYKDGGNDVYCSSGAMTLSYYAEGIGMERDRFIEELELMKGKNFVKHSDYYITGRGLTMATCNKIRFAEPIYVFVTFDTNQIFSQIESNGVELFIYKDGSPLYETNAEHQAAALSVIDGGNPLAYTGKTLDVRMFDDDTFTTAVFLCKKAAYFGTYAKMVFFDIILFILALAFGIFGAKRVARKIYNPIKDLIKNINNMPDTVEDEFVTIKGYIDNLEKKNVTMSEYMQNTAEDRLVFSMLFDEAEQWKVEAFISSRGLNGARFNAAIIEFTQYDAFYSEFTDEKVTVIKRIIIEMLKKQLSGYRYYHIVSIAPNGLIVVYSTERSDFAEDMAEIVRMSDSKFSIKLSVYIGDEYDSPQELYKSYSDAMYILKCMSLRVREGMIFTKKNITENTGGNFIYPIDIERSLISAALSADAKTVRESIHFIVTINSPDARTSSECLIQAIALISATIQKIMSECELEAAELFGEDWNLYLELRQANTFTELERIAVHIIEKIMDAASAQQGNYSKNIRTSIENYIENNYHEDISLGSLAAHLKLSETYVSKLFKSVMGVNFKEYVMHYKYLKAKEIMRNNPTYKLKDVAQMVGCNTPLTLSRLLKKYDKGGI